MNSVKNARSGLLIIQICLVFALSACSSFGGGEVSDDGIDYKSTVKHKSLEIPPDLTKPANNSAMDVGGLENQENTYSAYLGRQQSSGQQAQGTQALPDQEGIRYVHEGPNAWLELKGTRAQVWPRIREFWLKTGFVLVEDKPELGVMETEWAENRANIPKGTIRSLLSKVFAAAYTSGTRDKFRVRIEEIDDADKIELYIAHRGMVERIVGGDLSSEGSVWEVRPSDPDLEAVMLKRLMVHLGLTKQQATRVLTAKQPENAQLNTDGERPVLVINKDFSRAWRLLGLALDRVNFSVVDRNRSKGVYYVKYSDPDRKQKKSGLSRLKFWSDDKQGEETLYQVTMLDDNDTVRVLVNNDKGEVEASSTAERILTLLHEQLK